MTSANDFDRALISPEEVFSSPKDVADEATLTPQQKMKILKRWKLTARELLVATEENMSGGESSKLDEVNKAITQVTERHNLTEDDVD